MIAAVRSRLESSSSGSVVGSGSYPMSMLGYFQTGMKAVLVYRYAFCEAGRIAKSRPNPSSLRGVS